MKKRIPIFLDIIDDKKSIISMKVFFTVIFGLSILVIISSISYITSLR
ncbi:hypothetical protein H5T89_05240 [bacterium]|nr:hypothetical protein [bacterium]